MSKAKNRFNIFESFDRQYAEWRSMDVPAFRKTPIRKRPDPARPEGPKVPVDRGLMRIKGLARLDNDLSQPTDAGGVVLASDRDNIWVDQEDNHTLIFGATGSNKSRRVCMPTILSLARCGESMIVADCKGELLEATRGYLEGQGYNILNFNLRDPVGSEGWNPLTVPYRLYRSKDPRENSDGCEMVFDLAATLSPPEGKDPYWDLAAQDTIAGAMFLLFDVCDDENYVNIVSVQAIINMIARDNSILEGYLNSLGPDSNVFNCMSGAMYNSDVTKRCVMSMVRKSLRPLSSYKALTDMLSTNDIDLYNLSAPRTAVFITVPDERTTFNMLVSLFVRQAYVCLINEASRLPGCRLETRISFILDEFGSFPKVSQMDAMITASRSRGIRFLLILQGLGQLKHRYGENTASTIIGNATNLVYIYSREKELLEYVSELAGKDDRGRFLLSTSGLQKLDKDKGEMLVFHARESPCVTSLIDISEYGCPVSQTEKTVERVRNTKIFDMQSALLPSSKDAKDLFCL